MALFTGCSDRLTGPEAAHLVDALESSLSAFDPERAQQFFWDRELAPFGGHESSLLRNASAVVLHRDGHALRYRGFVFESVRVPLSDIDCMGTRWSALLWPKDRNAVDVTFSGGRFDQRLVPQSPYCSDGHHFVTVGPEPTVYVAADDAQHTWVSTDGEGDISPGIVIGECPFLAMESARWLRDMRGMSCDLTRHRVRFRAQLQRTNLSSRPLVFEGANGSSEIELPSTEIIGIRITFHCDGTERTKDACPRKRDS
ncbi:MAG TPA: hypothetical protein VEZ49_01440 [Gemmatimonadales bacterium]|nr:hypothetical protein [Gemmatimonadales bacterium]